MWMKKKEDHTCFFNPPDPPLFFCKVMFYRKKRCFQNFSQI